MKSPTQTMNYFGHAAIAGQFAHSASFVLGSMLPDLCSMVGVECNCPSDRSVKAGLDFHIATDAVFHQTDVFVTHNRRVLAAFRELNISRGPARACSHIGVEMLIDAVLVERRENLGAYVEALRWGASELGAFRSGPFASDWSLSARLKLKRLFSHLADRGAEVFSPSFTRIRDRFAGALGHRAKLKPSTAELDQIATFLARDDQVRRDVPTLLAEMAQLSLYEGGVSTPPRLAYGSTDHL